MQLNMQQNIMDFCPYRTISLMARAKVNLALDVTAKRLDGYHEIKTIMQTIKLHDKVIIDVIDKGIEIECNKCIGFSGYNNYSDCSDCSDCSDLRLVAIPLNHKNTAYKAAELFIKKYNIDCGVKIRLEKNIPVAAGLAGGSSDAAAVLTGMSRLFNCGEDENELMCLGREIGADVPYCIKGGTALAEGIGEILTGLKNIPAAYIVLVVPRISVSTAWVYENLDIRRINKRPDMKLLISAINEGNINMIGANMLNVLETVTAEKFGVINIIKEKLREYGAAGSVMSGSGPSVFGLFTDKKTAEDTYKSMAMYANKSTMFKNWDLFITETV
ncbi:MAG TPA: 4-(cytidine 5'-diphospho)-2-C-methyl-D-erythritol kinase [Clostridiales bacterium]|nr:4-(cytidine 5'-diphospho)-2-C-methyl-D-erythritol kinase [Clostridiales bacterium]